MKRVLIVDDKEDNLYYLQVLLSSQGYQIDAARHGAEALVMARAERPDLIVSDLLMPVMDGYTLLRHWKADPVLREIPFVVYTATYTEAEDERLAMSLGADGFILKPSDPDDFVARLNQIQKRLHASAPAVGQPESSADHGLLKLYSETLIRKLEEKSLLLEQTNKALEADIIERRRTEAILRLSEANLAAAQRIAHFGSWELDLGEHASCALRWSDEMYRIAGLAPQQVEMSNDLFYSMVSDQDRERILAARTAVQHGEQPYSTVYRLARPNGDVRIVHELAQLFVDEHSGDPSRLIGTAHDITEQRKADEALRASEYAQRKLAEQLDAEHARLRDAQRLGKVASWESDIGTGKMTWSGEAHRILEIDAVTIHLQRSNFFAMVHPDDRNRVTTAFDESQQDGSPGAIEHRLLMADGRVKHVEQRWQFARDKYGQTRRVIGTCRDVTEQRLAQVESEHTAALLKAVADNIPDVVFVKDLEGRYLLFNKAAARLLGRSQAEVLGHDDTLLFSAEQAQAVIAVDREVMRLGRVLVSEEVLTINGTTRTFSAAKAPYLDAQGTIQGLVGISRDISQRKEEEAAVRNSEAELRLLIETMPQIAWISGSDGKVLHFNQQWVLYTGLSVGESRVDAGHSRIHPDERDGVVQTWAHCLVHGIAWEIEYRLLGADNEYRWMLGRAQPLHGDDGITKWFGTATDIDAIRRSADAIWVSEERFRLLSRATNDAIWDWDVVKGTLWWNDAFETVFGYSPSAIEPSIDAWSSRIHPDDVAATIEDLHRCIARGEDVWTRHYRFRKADGSYVQVTDRGHLIRGDQGEPLRMVGGMVDMSDRLALEEQLRQSQRLESVGQLTGGIAHDFNNLLTVILGNAELLSEQLVGQPALRGMADMVMRAGNRGAELIERLLAFACNQALDAQSVDVNQLLTDFDSLLRRSLGVSVELKLRQADDLWPALVDSAQLENAVLNLCLNARDGMPSGGWLAIQTANVHLDAAGSDQVSDFCAGDYVMLSISDSGVGIAPEQLRRVFEPFYTTKRDGKGTGLGLPMVYGFVKQSGGQIHIDSELGKGTTVTLYLPRADTAAVVVERTDPGHVCTGGDETILLVEDDELVRLYAAAQLRKLGYRIVECSNANAALEALHSDQEIALLFTDVVMPGMSGRVLADLAKQRRPGLHVLYSSGYTDDAIVHQGCQESGLQLLRKPYGYADLAGAVRRALAATDGP